MTIMTAPGAPTIAYRANTTAHDSDTIAMPGKARRNIFRVSRRCFPLYSARHHHAARQASRRRTPGISTPHGMRRIRTAYGSNYFPS